MYTLEFYSFDCDSVLEGVFDTVEEALDRWANIGSRWIFYPIGAIFTKGGMVKVASQGMEFVEGKYRKAFEEEVRNYQEAEPSDWPSEYPRNNNKGPFAPF